MSAPLNSNWPHGLNQRQCVILWTIRHLNQLMDAGLLEGPRYRLTQKSFDILEQIPPNWKPDDDEIHSTMRALEEGPK